ncbi:MAG: DnaD domain protein [Clostridia bacterium]|nr:DnaD domain protein [Clostridia bacterium]
MNYQFEDTRMPCFAVPERVVDQFMNIATGAQLKVLLYLLRFDKLGHTSEGIAEFCNLKPEEVDDAVRFWVREKVFVLEQGKLRLVNGIKTVQTKELPKVAPTIVLAETGEDFQAMVAEIQRIVGKPINSTTVSLFYNFAENLHFSPEMIVQLAAYCNSIGKFAYRYMEAVAVDWFDEGITTFEQAEKKIRQLEARQGLENRLRKAFGIATNFSAKQKEFIQSWLEAGITEELILEAYNRCMDAKGQMSFPYINKILQNWGQKGYKKVSDIREEAATGRQQHSGLSELEQMMIAQMQSGGNNE